MKKFSILVILFLLVTTISCSSVYKHSYDYDRTVDFASLKTYSWLPLEEDVKNELVRQRIKQTVNSELASKGYKMVSENPDFLILAKVETKQEAWSSDGGPYGGGYYSRGSYASRSAEIRAGTLLLEFVDAKSKNPIWWGNASTSLSRSYSPEKLDKLVGEVVQKILKEFPPPSSQ
jgi:hypothetical protein